MLQSHSCCCCLKNTLVISLFCSRGELTCGRSESELKEVQSKGRTVCLEEKLCPQFHESKWTFLISHNNSFYLVLLFSVCSLLLVRLFVLSFCFFFAFSDFVVNPSVYLWWWCHSVLDACALQVWSVAFNDTGNRLVSVSDDCSLIVYTCPLWWRSYCCIFPRTLSPLCLFCLSAAFSFWTFSFPVRFLTLCPLFLLLSVLPVPHLSFHDLLCDWEKKNLLVDLERISCVDGFLGGHEKL